MEKSYRRFVKHECELGRGLGEGLGNPLEDMPFIMSLWEHRGQLAHSRAIASQAGRIADPSTVGATCSACVRAGSGCCSPGPVCRGRGAKTRMEVRRFQATSVLSCRAQLSFPKKDTCTDLNCVLSKAYTGNFIPTATVLGATQVMRVPPR